MVNTTTLSASGLDYELHFWRQFVKTPRFLQDWLSDQPTKELNEDVRKLLQAALTPELRVLDVGSGPVSILHGTIPKDQLYAVDPLGLEYEQLFDFQAHNLKPPEAIAAENLEWLGDFDIVHMSNALDHTVNPITAYENMLRATRPGGFVIIQGFVNEGTYEKWSGFHQWDISVNKLGHLFIANRQGGGVAYSKNKLSSQYYKLSTGKTWMVWIAQK